jgi:hypothetical protein
MAPKPLAPMHILRDDSVDKLVCSLLNWLITLLDQSICVSQTSFSSQLIVCWTCAAMIHQHRQQFDK